MNKRNILYIAICAICIAAVAIAVYQEMFSKKVKPENIIGQENTTVEESPQPVKAKTQQELLEEFNNIFNNKLNKQSYSVENVNKINAEGYNDKEVVFTFYDFEQKEEGKYEMNIKLPVFNVDGTVGQEVNNITQNVFATKANNIISGVDEYTTFTTDYTAYVNNNIISLIVRATLKEGNNAQRIIVQSYNYDMNTKKLLTFNDLLEMRGYNTKTINQKIIEDVKEAGKEAEVISNLTGQIMYKRTLNDAMYSTDNIKNFFIGEKGQIYVVFAYGNKYPTSEIDIVKIN